MATNLRFPDYQHATPAHEAGGEELLSPVRVVLGIACVLIVALMLSAIASVARAQVQKGEDFQFSRQLEASSTQFYANHGGSDTTEFVRASLGNGS